MNGEFAYEKLSSGVSRLVVKDWKQLVSFQRIYKKSPKFSQTWKDFHTTEGTEEFKVTSPAAAPHSHTPPRCELKKLKDTLLENSREGRRWGNTWLF